MNTNDIAKEFRHLSNFPEMAKATAEWGKKNPDASDEEVREWIRTNYGSNTLLTMREEAVPLKIFGKVDTHIPANAIGQMHKVMQLPVTTRGALMPDAHFGYAMPIGGVAALENAISPSFVGYDISCMVQLSILDIDVADFEAELFHFAHKLREVTAFGMGADFAGKREHPVMQNSEWEDIPIARKLKPLAQRQLGSSGGGNHFADLVVIEVLKDTSFLSVGQKLVGLLTHSGSRGAGHKIATHYVKKAADYTREIATGIPKGYEWLPIDHELGHEYHEAMKLMGRYAQANHDLIHGHFFMESGVEEIASISNRHNYAWVEENQVVHRKGATPANLGQLGLVPGTSGTPSYIVRGLGNEASMNSSSHGAGRPHSRTEAKKQHDESRVQQHMEQNDILHFGLSPDETFMAYKPIETVIGLQEGVLIESVARMTPRVVIMGGKSDDNIIPSGEIQWLE